MALIVAATTNVTAAHTQALTLGLSAILQYIGRTNVLRAEAKCEYARRNAL